MLGCGGRGRNIIGLKDGLGLVSEYLALNFIASREDYNMLRYFFDRLFNCQANLTGYDPKHIASEFINAYGPYWESEKEDILLETIECQNNYILILINEVRNLQDRLNIVEQKP